VTAAIGSWICLLFGFLFLELTSIDKEREASEALSTRQQESESFRQIGEGIKGAITQSQQQFDATMKRSDKVVGLQVKELNNLSENLHTITGSESYAFLQYVPGQPFLAFVHKGDYPLYGVSARIVDLDQVKKTNSLNGVTVAIGDMIRGHANMEPPLNLGTADRFNANVSSQPEMATGTNCYVTCL
jgi:hypothetical protein